MGDNPKFLGCTTTGLVTNHFLSYTGPLAGGAFLTCDAPFFEMFYEEHIDDNEFAAGKNMAEQIRNANTAEGASVLLFYDSVKVTSLEGPFALSVATTILEGFHSHFNEWPTLAGMGAMGEINLAYPCAAWGKDKISRHGLAAATIQGAIKMDTIIMHGTRPMGAYHTITSAKDNIVYELMENRHWMLSTIYWVVLFPGRNFLFS